MSEVSASNSLALWPETFLRTIEEEDTGKENRQEKAGRAAGEVTGSGLRRKLTLKAEKHALLNSSHSSCASSASPVAAKRSLCEAFLLF